jgi:hypothetical protein
MINLLPADYKQEILYARRNNHLRAWLVGAGVALAGLGIIVAGGLLIMQQQIHSYDKQLAQTRESLQAQNVEQTQKRIEEISNNTKLTLQVLSREVLFSKLIRQIGSSLPPNTALKSLEIDTVQGGIQLNAVARDFNAGSQVQVNLQDPKNGVFEKADINSITCSDPNAAVATNPDATARAFPCDVSLRALFSKNNTSYLYIVPTPGATQ